MKQYVLDEPGMRPLHPEPPAPEPARGRWRWPVVLAALAAAGLVAARSFVDRPPEAKPRPAEVASVPVYVAPVTADVPRPNAATSAAASPVTLAIDPPVPSRVTREKGRYVVDLHGAEVGPALAMLSEATHATVSGSDVLVASTARITASFVAASPLEAWKGVFGNVASFAMSCGPSTCAVRFVSLGGSGDASSPLPSSPTTTAAPLQPALPAPPVAPPAIESSEQPMADN